MATPPLDLSRIGQIGMVVRDLDAAMEGFWRTAGVGPWKVYTNSAPPLKCFYRGRPVAYRARVALAQSGPMVVELIQLLEGEGVHREFLESGREGVEHLGIYVPDLEAALKPFLERGVKLLQSAEGLGVKGDGSYAFLDTESTLGTLLELIQTPSERVAPERVFP